MNIQRLSILTVLLPVTLFSASSSSPAPASPVSAQPEIIKACPVFAYALDKKRFLLCLHTIALLNTGRVLLYRTSIDPEKDYLASKSKSFPISKPANTTDQNTLLGTLNSHQGTPFDDIINMEAASNDTHDVHPGKTHLIRIMTTHKDKTIRITLWDTANDSYAGKVFALELPK